jgi:transcriptional regulator GlxA family with amidase domain
MQQTMKQYITAMRINHVRALLSDTDKTILDIALTAGFAPAAASTAPLPVRGHAAAAVP